MFLTKHIFFYKNIEYPGSPTGQYSGRIKTASWTNGEENSSRTKKIIPRMGKKLTFLGFIPQISQVSSQFYLISSQFKPFCNFWDGKAQIFGASRQFWSYLASIRTRAREKLGKKTGFLDQGGWEKNRICGQNIDQCFLSSIIIH